MYDDAKSRVRVGWGYSYVFSVGINQGSILSSLFLIVLEALSQELWTGCSVVLYIDDLAITAKSLVEVKNRLSIWKLKFAKKDLKVNISKTKILIKGRGLITIKEPGRFTCSLHLKDVRVNSVYCSSCKH